MARGLIKHRVGAGMDTMMWIDFWLPNGLLCSQLGLSEMEILQLDTNIKVDSLIYNSQWVVPASLQHIQFLQSHYFNSQIQNLQPPSLQPDFIEWLPSPPIGFSQRHTMDYFSPPSLMFTWHNLLWFKHHIPKHSHILWLAIKGRLYTLDTKPMKHKHHTNACYLCMSDWESIDHLFFKCKFNILIWEFIQNVAGFYIRPDCWADLISWCLTTWCNKYFTTHKLLLSAAIYFIWIERNARAFRNKSTNAQHIICLIKDCIRKRLASMALRKGTELYQKETMEDLYKLFLEGCAFAGGHSWRLSE
ncbi:uncharacterized protein LOC132267550 [Cornus florida]|uniref:uncharacterized protein LOC132267550 n=1 Tax=Cornus florida TaxID=4283 RepID=UPI00289661DD|nr:uncharacterized protein LOC132267550 [Cornus florida]